MKKTAAATIVAFSLVASTAPYAVAANSNDTSNNQSHTSPASRATLISDSIPSASFSTEEVLQLLLAGTGPMASDELVSLLGFDPNRPEADMAELSPVINQYINSTEGLEEDVTIPFQSGDPTKVDSSLRVLSSTFNDFIQEKVGENQGHRLAESLSQNKGWAWMGANVAIYANAVGVANAVGYSNVGVATLALATIGFVTWYLPDEESATGNIDRDERVESITGALSRI